MCCVYFSYFFFFASLIKKNIFFTAFYAHVLLSFCNIYFFHRVSSFFFFKFKWTRQGCWFRLWSTAHGIVVWVSVFFFLIFFYSSFDATIAERVISLRYPNWMGSKYVLFLIIIKKNKFLSKIHIRWYTLKCWSVQLISTFEQWTLWQYYIHGTNFSIKKK